MTSILDRVQALCRSVATEPDPIAAMKALESEANEEERRMFPMLWESFWGAMRRAETERDDQA